jgi:hypothetical protein
MADGRIAGRVLHRGAPQAGCQVLAVDEAAGAVVADAETGPDGTWELPAGDLLVFARCRGEALGVVARPAADGLDLEIAPTYPLTVLIEADGMPDWARPQVLLTPVRIADVDLRWVHAPVREMTSAALARIVPAGRQLERFVQPGTWWLTAGFESVPDARAEGMADAIRWTAIAARTADGRELAPLKHGFEVEVDGPVDVTVTLAPTG